MKIDPGGTVFRDIPEVMALIHAGKVKPGMRAINLDYLEGSNAIEVARYSAAAKSHWQRGGEWLASKRPCDDPVVLEDQHARRRETLHTPEPWASMDIAAWVLDQCDGDAELQRCGEELLMFQDRDLFPMLCWFKYFVDTARENNLVWGVGRGSSVASFVLYKIGVHKIDSLYYGLDINEFLR